MEKQLSLGKNSCQSPQPRIGDTSSAELFDIVGNLPEDILGEVIVYLAEQKDLQKLISWQTVSTEAAVVELISMLCLALTDCAIRFQKDGACFSTIRQPKSITKHCLGAGFSGTYSLQLTTVLAGPVMSRRFPTLPFAGRYGRTWP